MTQSLDQAMGAFQPNLPLGVAYSGGADSTALLLACHLLWPGQVSALHVNHGLQAAALDFENHCEAFCMHHGIPLRTVRVDARRQKGQSPEEAARTARYQSLVVLAKDPSWGTAISTVALAQHADDQVETLLLALSRGAGLAGLGAMRKSWMRAGTTFCRPLLAVAGADIRSWLSNQGVQPIEDPSNDDPRYTRNRIRQQLLPVLQSVFPQFRDTFARSAAHAAQASALLEQQAAADWMSVVEPLSGKPRIKDLRTLETPAMGNLLRYWLRRDFSAIPSTAQLQELVKQVEACSTRGHSIYLKVASGFVVRKGAVLDWYNP